MGPSWYWMPDVFEKYFNDFNKRVEDYYSLKKLDPAYRVYFGKNDFIEIEDSLEQDTENITKDSVNESQNKSIQPEKISNSNSDIHFA